MTRDEAMNVIVNRVAFEAAKYDGRCTVDVAQTGVMKALTLCPDDEPHSFVDVQIKHPHLRVATVQILSSCKRCGFPLISPAVEAMRGDDEEQPS